MFIEDPAALFFNDSAAVLSDTHDPNTSSGQPKRSLSTVCALDGGALISVSEKHLIPGFGHKVFWFLGVFLHRKTLKIL